MGLTTNRYPTYTRHGLYGLVKPLLMRTRNIKKACVEEKVPLQKAIVTQGYLESNEKTQGLICHSASLGLNCDPESMVEHSLRSGEAARILDLHRAFQSPDLENMAIVYWFRHGRLCMIERQEVRLPDERHVCWKKRRQKGIGVMSDPIYGSSYRVFNNLI